MKKIILMLFITCSLFAQIVEVNTYTDSTQRDPQVAKFADGSYVIVWDSEDQVAAKSQSDIYMQKFDADNNKVNSETLVNEVTTGEQEKPAIAVNATGDLVVVWSSFTSALSIFDIKAKIYKHDGTIVPEFTVNTFVQNSQNEPSVAFLGDGNFVVVWESWFQDGSNKGIYAKRFDVDGNETGGELLVNTTTTNSQCRPVVKALGADKFIVAWESWKQVAGTDPGYDLFAKIFNNDASVSKEEFMLNTYTENFQWYVDLAENVDGGFIAAWCSWAQDGHDGGIFMQRFDVDGNKIGAEMIANKTTQYYQWLPKVKVNDAGDVIVVWSSWKQDGHREGIYTRSFDQDLKPTSLETKVNERTEGYQWEPDFFIKEGKEIFVVYPSWIDAEKDYEIKGKKSEPLSSQGSIMNNTFGHPEGESTAEFFVHVIDSTQLTGHIYEISFVKNGEGDYSADIKDVNTGQFVVTDFALDRGEQSFYLSELFDGIAVEIMPEYDFEVDNMKSYFINNSGSNLQFSYGTPGGSTASLAPIDCKLVWGTTEQDNDGNWVGAIDTAYSSSGKIEVACPFTAYNITDDEPIIMFIKENNPKNLQWDPGETITLMTPSQYDPGFPRFHAEILTELPTGTLVLPDVGDISFVLTSRPLTNDDKFRFETISANITDVEENKLTVGTFALEQNYPNPFNPATNINFTIPADGAVSLEVYNILGEKVSTLMNQVMKQGIHTVRFNGSNLASGIYIYALKHNGKFTSKKMMLLK